MRSSGPTQEPSPKGQQQNTNSNAAPNAAPEQLWTYRPLDVIGKGSFGIVALAEVVETGDKVAIKRVVHDPHRTSRELVLLQKIRQSTNAETTADTTSGAKPHPALVQLLTHYYTSDSATGGRFLNLVMDYLPLNLHELSRLLPHGRQQTSSLSSSPVVGCLGEESSTHLRGSPLTPSHSFEMEEVTAGITADEFRDARAGRHPRRRLRLLLVKLILFQLARGLAWLHHLHICHRDVKPGNVLFDPETLQVQLCDLGSAKEIVNKHDERNVFYICSRHYRAPELLFGALHYGYEVDLWSLGCIAAELVRDTGKPLFRGSTTVDQMSEIFKVLGAPSPVEMEEMSPQGAKAMALSYQQTSADPFSNMPAPSSATSTTTTATAAAPTSQPEASATTATASTSQSASSFAQSAEPPLSASPHTYAECYDVLKIRAMQWPALFPPGTPMSAVELVSRLLVYSPSSRLTAAQVVEHPFFEELFTLDWTTLRLVREMLPRPQRDSPRDSFAAQCSDDDVAESAISDEQKEHDTKLLNAVFGLAPGEKALYSDAFSARLTVKYKQLEHALNTL